MDDQELIRAILGGDRGAERALYDRHVDRVYGLAYRMTGQPETAEDLTQDAFLRAFDRLGTFRGQSAFSTWLHTVSMSVILNGLRKSQRHRQRETSLSLVGEAVDSTTARQSSPDLKRMLHTAVDQLTETLRTTLLLHDVEGFTHEEIGSMLGIPTGTSKARVSRARDQLRRIFRGEHDSQRTEVLES